MTSPPFALLRKKAYGNEDSDSYCDWFRPFAGAFHRALKDTGSLVIDIGGTWNKGLPTRSLYQFKLLIMLVEEYGFHLCQEHYWYNPSKLPSPTEWVNRRRLRVKDSDWSMSIITSATTTAERQKMRRQNLARHFGEDTFTDIVCLDLVRSKEDVLSGYAPSLWVEDNYWNALLGLKAGHQPVMINQTYNETERKAPHESVIWTDGLDQIADGILEAERLAKAA